MTVSGKDTSVLASGRQTLFETLQGRRKIIQHMTTGGIPSHFVHQVANQDKGIGILCIADS